MFVRFAGEQRLGSAGTRHLLETQWPDHWPAGLGERLRVEFDLLLPREHMRAPG